jgi:hypothetical protein
MQNIYKFGDVCVTIAKEILKVSLYLKSLYNRCSTAENVPGPSSYRGIVNQLFLEWGAGASCNQASVCGLFHIFPAKNTFYTSY